MEQYSDIDSMLSNVKMQIYAAVVGKISELKVFSCETKHLCNNCVYFHPSQYDNIQPWMCVGLGLSSATNSTFEQYAPQYWAAYKWRTLLDRFDEQCGIGGWNIFDRLSFHVIRSQTSDGILSISDIHFLADDLFWWHILLHHICSIHCWLNWRYIF